MLPKTAKDTKDSQSRLDFFLMPRDSAKAKGGDFEIVGKGNVVQHYLIDGKKHQITYTQALHTPTLNANLVSISALNRAGLTTTVGNRRGIMRKVDGTVVLIGKNVNGMYILETLDKPSHMQSLFTI